MKRGHFTEHADKLRALGLNIANTNDKDAANFQPILTALKTYKSIHSDVLVHKKFVISEGDGAYPEETWRMKLGAIVRSIRRNNIYSQFRSELEAIGFEYEEPPSTTSGRDKNNQLIEID